MKIPTASHGDFCTHLIDVYFCAGYLGIVGNKTALRHCAPQLWIEKQETKLMHILLKRRYHFIISYKKQLVANATQAKPKVFSIQITHPLKTGTQAAICHWSYEVRFLFIM